MSSTGVPAGPVGDAGSASVWAAAGIASLLVLTVMIVGFGSAASTRHRAASAADLAALAAAAHAASGDAQACARARWVTERMGVHLTGCRLRGWDALVEVTARPPDLIAGFGSASARARAGPTADSSGNSRTVVPRR
jgi:secretion/DNA translocation related TadE-like protein